MKVKAAKAETSGDGKQPLELPPFSGALFYQYINRSRRIRMNRIEASNVPFIKIALIGDSGVGKSTLSSALATGSFETSPIYR